MPDAIPAATEPAAAPAGATPEPAPTPQTPEPGATPQSAAAPSSEPKPEPQPQTYKLVVNGQERVISEEQAQHITQAAAALGMTPQEFIQASQLKAAAYQRFEESARMRRETEALLANLKGSTREALRRAGVDPREFARAEIEAAIAEQQQLEEEAALPPRVRAALEKARALEQEHAKLQAEAKQRQAAQLQGDAKAHFDRWNAELPAAMEKAGLPRTPEATRLVLAKMETMIKAGVPLDVGFAAAKAAEELQSRNFSLLGKMSPEAIVKALGQDAYNALLRHSVQAAGGTKPAPATPKPPEQKNGRRWMTEAEAEKFWRG